MSVNFDNNANLSFAIRQYNKHTDKSLDKLFTCLKNTKTRVQFESWLIDHAAKHVSSIDYNWQSRVIAKICAGIEASGDTSTVKLEDNQVVRLIIQADPLKESKNFLEKFSQLIQGLYSHIYTGEDIDSANEGFNTATVASEIKYASLPSTCTALLERLLENEDLQTVLATAIVNSNIALVAVIAENYPEEFRAILAEQNKNTALLASFIESWNTSKSPEERELLMKSPGYFVYQEVLKLPPSYSYIARAALNANSKLLEILKNVAPKEFEIGMNLQYFFRSSSEGSTQMTTASFLEALKTRRPHNYKKFTETLSGKNEKAKYKEIFNRCALHHAFDLTEKSLVTNDDLAVLYQSRRDSPGWYKMFIKDADIFKSSFPDLLDDKELQLFKDILHVGANLKSSSVEELFSRIQAGYPVVLDAGFIGHRVTILIWGDQFIICNRGGDVSRPLETYHFHPERMSLQDIKDLRVSETKSEEYYKNLILETLPEKLGLYVTDSDRAINEAGHTSLPLQTVGNCTFVSPITAVFATRALMHTRGLDEEGRLLPQDEFNEGSSISQLNEAVFWYHS